MRVFYCPWFIIYLLIIVTYTQEAHANKQTPFVFLVSEKAHEHQNNLQGWRLHVDLHMGLETEGIQGALAPTLHITIGPKKLAMWGHVDLYTYQAPGILSDGLPPQESMRILRTDFDRGSRVTLSHHWRDRSKGKWSKRLSFSYHPWSSTSIQLGHMLDTMWQPNHMNIPGKQTIGAWSVELQWTLFRLRGAIQLALQKENLKEENRYLRTITTPRPSAIFQAELQPNKWLFMYIHGAYFQNGQLQTAAIDLSNHGWGLQAGFRWSLLHDVEPVQFLSRRRKNPETLFTYFSQQPYGRNGLSVRLEGSIRTQVNGEQDEFVGHALGGYITGQIDRLVLGIQAVWKSRIWHSFEHTPENVYITENKLGMGPIWQIALDASVRLHKTLTMALRMSRIQPTLVTPGDSPRPSDYPQLWYGTSFTYATLSQGNTGLLLWHMQLRWTPWKYLSIGLETWFSWNESETIGVRNQLSGLIISLAQPTPQLGIEFLAQVRF